MILVDGITLPILGLLKCTTYRGIIVPLLDRYLPSHQLPSPLDQLTHSKSSLEKPIQALRPPIHFIPSPRTCIQSPIIMRPLDWDIRVGADFPLI